MARRHSESGDWPPALTSWQSVVCSYEATQHLVWLNVHHELQASRLTYLRFWPWFIFLISLLWSSDAVLLLCPTTLPMLTTNPMLLSVLYCKLFCPNLYYCLFVKSCKICFKNEAYLRNWILFFYLFQSRTDCGDSQRWWILVNQHYLRAREEEKSRKIWWTTGIRIYTGMPWIFNNFPLNFEFLSFDLRLWKVGLNHVVLHLNAFNVLRMALESRRISLSIPLCVFACGNPSMTTLSERRRFWTAAEVDIALVTIRARCWTSKKPLWL